MRLSTDSVSDKGKRIVSKRSHNGFQLLISISPMLNWHRIEKFTAKTKSDKTYGWKMMFEKENDASGTVRPIH